MNISILPVETIGCYVVVSATFVALDGRSVVPPCALSTSSLMGIVVAVVSSLMGVVVAVVCSGCPSIKSS